MAKRASGTPGRNYYSVMIDGREQRIPYSNPEPDEIEAIKAARAAFERGDFGSLEELQAE